MATYKKVNRPKAGGRGGRGLRTPSRPGKNPRRARPPTRPGGAASGGMGNMTLEQLSGMMGGGRPGMGTGLETGGGYASPAMGGGLQPFQPNIGMGVNRGPAMPSPGGTPQISQPFTPPPSYAGTGMGGMPPRLPPVMPPPNNIGKSFGSGVPTGFGSPSGGPNSAPIGGRPYGY